MTESERMDFKSVKAEAERLSQELTDLENRNRKRRAKGRKPLPDPQARKDMMVLRTRHRTGPVTVDGADALKLYEMRKEQMSGDMDDDGLDGDAAGEAQPEQDGASSLAIRQAAAARRVQDMKNGRVDHDGTWSEEGAKIEGGDDTVIVDRSEIAKAWGAGDAKAEAPVAEIAPAPRDPDALEEFKKDLYGRMRVSFDSIERSLSDLQGRVSEIVCATTPPEPADLPSDGEGGEKEFRELLDRKTPVVFDVGGTKMTFDAITVFSAPPCITIVSRIGSAKITPKPGAQLLLSYEMDGVKYANDPVTFLGTRFDLPMFGLSFVGFIRDREADMIDAAAGVSASGGVSAASEEA